MKAQDKPETETVYRVYLKDRNRSYFSKQYLRESTALSHANSMDHIYGHMGYEAYIETVEIGPAGLRSENGGHSTGTPSQVQDNSPVG